MEIMVKSWLACPYCDLAFHDDEEYKRHLQTEHAGRKNKNATMINSQTTQLD